MRHLQRGCMRKQMIVDPAREEGGFHRRRPRLWESLHPSVQIESCYRNRALCMNLTTCILHAVADRFLVNIQADVIHTLHGGASLVVSESARSLSSAFVHQALLLTHTFKQSAHNNPPTTIRPQQSIASHKAPHSLSNTSKMSSR